MICSGRRLVDARGLGNFRTRQAGPIVGWVIAGAAPLGAAAVVERRRAQNTVEAPAAGRHERTELGEATEEELEEAVVA